MKRKTVCTVAAGVLILAGISLLVWPLISEWQAQREFEQQAVLYQAQVEQMDDTEELLQAAREYNAVLYERTQGLLRQLTDEERQEYHRQLAVSSIMGFIQIQGNSLPIYHGTSDDVLAAGIGHLEESSLPVGGESVNTVLTGHSGLPSRILFTNLRKLKEGDRFAILVLGETLTYEVIGKQVLLPEEVQLEIEPGEDICTLVTCTPVGINTHRLVITARRID